MRKSGPNLGLDRWTILSPSRALGATSVSAMKPVAGGSNWFKLGSCVKRKSMTRERWIGWPFWRTD
jgi:hypothetical protein